MIEPFYTSKHLIEDGIAHWFFGRQGGVSTGIYASLNAGPGSNDAPEAVAENRARSAARLGVAPDRLLSAHQIHSAVALRVDGPWTGPRPQADALVTTVPGLALSVLAADCAPALFVDPQARVIGAAHAGWKGALGGVLEATIAAMVDAGARTERILACVGPCIGQESYEVGPDFHERFLSQDLESARFFAPGAGDRRHFDLGGYCCLRLARVGVWSEHARRDTFALETALFSHRRSVKRGEPDYGRNLSTILLQD